MGHLEPFDLRYVAVGNEDYGKKNYCDIKLSPIVMALLDNWIILPISMIIIDANMVFCLAHKFDYASHSGPKDFVSEYAVNMSLLVALAMVGYRSWTYLKRVAALVTEFLVVDYGSQSCDFSSKAAGYRMV
ncbi:hypothetical protein RHGRI_007411 [Rhododendron griersonianum]|uniref:Uncharacterized protein n=1 Tax=Rhododendron griersonianum TaxID=479676 RepID=A0AAV6KXG7_9ERIC|nr:hypothetical protein RHGRI_007411 [Rhododendron griersonianum]